MQIKIIAIGQKMPEWVENAYEEYSKRLPSEWKLNLTSLEACPRTSKANIKKTMLKESQALLSKTSSQDFIISLDRQGKSLTTLELSEKLHRFSQESLSVCFLIGGPEGLTPECLQKSNFVWSLSSLTFPHTLVRVILIEQLYRAWSILANHPYHR